MICPKDCPNFIPFEGENKKVYCVVCGDDLSEDRGFYRKNGFPYCESCLDFSDTETLVRICEIPKRKWLEQMGFVYESKEDAHDITEVL